jgi:transposase
MKQKSGPVKQPAEAVVKDLRRATRRQFSAEEKIRIVLEGLRGEESIAELCRREDIASSMYYGWSKDFLEAGKKRLAGDTATWLWSSRSCRLASWRCDSPTRDSTLCRRLGSTACSRRMTSSPARPIS